jgi:cytochrome P450
MNMSQSIPMAPGALPVLGHIGPLLRDPGAFLTGLPAHGELVRIRLGPAAVIMVCDAEMTRQVLLDDRTFDRGGPFFDTAREVISDGLATCTYHKHRRLRRLVQPAFHHARLPEYARVMVAQIAAGTEAWHDGQILDVLSETENFAARILAANLFSDKLASSEVRQITRDINTIIKGMYRRMLMSPLIGLPTPGNVRYNHALTRVRDVTGRVVAGRRAGGADSGDLVSALLAAHDPEDADRGLSDDEIHDQVTTFLLAGTETTAALVAWALHLVATHPDIEERLHAELDTMLGGDAVTYDDLPRLELTGRIITETLRLYPQTWVLTRTVTRDARLANHAIPAGTTLAVSPYLLHRQGVFDRPDAFDPDRWLPERAATAPRNAYMPFGAGARQCIGNDYGRVQGALALAAIAARWRLQPLPGRRVRPSLSVSVRPRSLRMRAVARTPALIHEG